MITRDDFYRHFGPQLLEAIIRFIVQELNTLRSERNKLGAGILRLMVPQINTLRAEHGMTEITLEQAYAVLENDIGKLDPLNKDLILDELKTIWDSLPDYNWMED
jgi:hypothetical protein